MKIKINPLTILLFIILSYTGNIKPYLVTYALIFLHELAHLIAAFSIGLKADSIVFSPFGVNLKLKNKIIHSFSDEIILYSAGPLINGVLALLALLFKNSTLYMINLSLMFINILPIIPLDGGMIAMRLMTNFTGRKRARQILSFVSVLFSIILLWVALYSTHIGRMNISFFIISILLLGNILTSKEKYDMDFISAISGSKKKTNKVNFVIVDKDHPATQTIKTISQRHTTYALLVDDNGEIIKIIPEKKIIEGEIIQ